MDSNNKVIPTGNEFISIPSISENDASISGVTMLHMGYKGLIEINGNETQPFLKPVISVEGINVGISRLHWNRLNYWIPCFEGEAGPVGISGVVIVPVGERGFIYRLKVINSSNSAKQVSIGLNGCWQDALHSINESKPIDGKKLVYKSNWNGSIVFDLKSGINIMSFAPMYDGEMNLEYGTSSDTVYFNISRNTLLEAGNECIIDFYWGFGFEEVSAATSAKEMLRKGFAFELAETEKWLADRSRFTGDTEIDRILNTNLLFNFFFASGKTLDSEDFVLVTSRSPRYYVSASYWDRDSLLWSFPAILLVDADYAEEMLRYVFNTQIKNIGIHSRYIDGTILEPGFELDELCAPVLALDKFIKKTGNYEIIKEKAFEAGISKILKILNSKKHITANLYETFLQPTDDMADYQYLTYDNVLVWKAYKCLSEIYSILGDTEKGINMANLALGVEKSIWEHCTAYYNNRRVFAWSVNLKDGYNFYDEPPGSLQLLPFYGFCDSENEVYGNTMKFIRSPENKYSFALSSFPEIGCAHAPHPWVLSIANSLLCGRKEHCRDILIRAEMDNGTACESIDEYSGKCATGEAFATCAGFLAYSIYEAYINNEIENASTS